MVICIVGGKDSSHLEGESLGSHIYEKLARVKGEDEMHVPININRSKLKEHEEELGKVAKALIEEGMITSWK